MKQQTITAGQHTQLGKSMVSTMAAPMRNRSGSRDACSSRANSGMQEAL